ncbi:hypothetical protein DV515_00008472 [Chloebia gouldiae]|uniref:HECT domain-containing protein n=1 Tax=Chloebia gouldiae TaxID=44316 RepID=A0A3L8SF80_CHLGU|nr:hypothetical protein DV515_00008472 [Chloebia gouldiae]
MLKALQVSFLGEMGMDEGAVSQELFSVASRTLCLPSTSTFCHFASGLVWLPRQTLSCEDEDTFLLIGTLCGMALFNLHMVPFPFPRALYKKLLDLAPTLEDLEDLLPTMGRSLRKILNYKSDSLDSDFTNVTYRQYTNLDQTIRNFWTVFHKLPEEKKKMFFAFLSGSDRISGYRLEWFKFWIEDPQVENPDESLPY